MFTWIAFSVTRKSQSLIHINVVWSFCGDNVRQIIFFLAAASPRRFVILVKNSTSLKGNLLLIACFPSALGQTLLLSARLRDKVMEGRDVYQLIDWSHEDWIHHLNERAPVSSHLLLPALSFLSRGMSKFSHSAHQAFSQPPPGEGRNVFSSQ